MQTAPQPSFVKPRRGLTITDGFGTYDDETQASPIFSHIGSRGYFWFLLFQLFTTDAFDLPSTGQGQALAPAPGSHPIVSMIVGDKHGPWIPFPSHSLNVYLGPKVQMLALDCRAERKLTEIVRPETYEKCFGELRREAQRGVEQVVLLLGVPIGMSSLLERDIVDERNREGTEGMMTPANA